MPRLFWKIFLGFWLITLSMMVTVLWIGSIGMRQQLIPLRDQTFVTAYALAAVSTYESGGNTALSHWLGEYHKHSHQQGYLVGKTGQNVLAQHLPNDVRNIELSYLPKNAFREGDFIISPWINLKNGEKFRFVSREPNLLRQLADNPIPLLSMRIIVAFLLSGILCFFLSRYLSRPATVLKRAAKKLGGGELSTRIDPSLVRRHDEFGQLAQSFNEMATRLDSMVHAQQRLLQDISHELRSPLARVQIALALARKQNQGSDEKALDRIEHESEKLNALIGEVLHFAHLKTTVPSFEDDVDVVLLLEEICMDANFEFKREQKAVNFIKKIPTTVKGNRTLLSRGFENIIRNALRYTQPNSQVTVAMTRLEGEVLISISDQGPGVPAAALPKLFEPFYRVDDARSQATGGYGLGLAIAKQAILHHGGEINAKNRPNSGLEVIIRL